MVPPLPRPKWVSAQAGARLKPLRHVRALPGHAAVLTTASPNAQIRISGCGDCQCHPGAGPRALGETVGADRCTLLEPTRADVLLGNSGKRAAVRGRFVAQFVVPDIAQATVGAVTELEGNGFKLG